MEHIILLAGEQSERNFGELPLDSSPQNATLLQQSQPSRVMVSNLVSLD